MARTILTCSLGLLIIVQTVTFSYYYFVEYPRNPDTELAFFKGFDRALRIGLETAQPAERILVTDRIQLPYFLTAFFANYPPDKYTSDIRYRLEPGVIDVQSLGRFYFGADNLPQDNLPYVYVLAKWDEPPCANPQKFLETRLWNVGRCGN